MKKIITRIKRLALALCFVTPLVSWAAVDYTGTAYEPWSYSTVYVWRVPANSTITDLAYSTFAPVASDGTVGEAVTQTGDAYLSWAAGKTGYVAPGKVLCYDETGYKASIDSTFTPLSFGGLKVDALADETAGTPYTIVGSSSNARYTDFGYTSHSTYFEFNKSFTVNRSSATRCYGAVTIQVAKGATFKSQGSLWAEVGGTVKLTGEGTVELPSGLYVNDNSTSTLDLSAATRPTITGDVTIYDGGAIALPAGTEPSEETPFTVCSGTLTVYNYNYVKIGDADPISATLTVSGGAITGIEPYSLERTFTSDYPTVVPAGAVFTFQGGTEDEPVTINSLSVAGTLKLEGYFNFPNNYNPSDNAELDVVSGSVTVTRGSTNWVKGTIKIREDATFVNAQTDALNYNGTVNVYVWGTLNMGATRWSLGSNNTINLYEGCTVTGSGDGNNGTLDWIGDATANLNVSGAVTIDAPIKIRGTATVNVTVDSGANDGLTLNGSTIGVGTIVKKGAGLIKFTTNPGYAITCQNGAFTFSVDATPTITYPALPTSSTSMWYATRDTWKGTVVINAQTSVNGSVPLAKWGTANSKIVLKGLSGSSCYFGQSADTEVQANVQIDGNVTFNQGWSGNQYILDKVTGTDADVTLSLKTASGMTSMNYTIQTLDFAGTIALVGGSTKSAGCNYQFTIGNIVKAETPQPGTKIVKLTRTVGTGCTDTITVNLANTTLNGEAADLEVKSDGIYVAVPTVTITVPTVPNASVVVSDGTTTYTPTTEGGTTYSVPAGSTITVTYTAAEGYKLEGTGTFNFSATDGYSVDVSSTKSYAIVARTDDDQTFTRVPDALTYAYMTTGVEVVTVIDSTWPDDGTYDEYFAWDATARTYTKRTFVARIGAVSFTSLAAAIAYEGAEDPIVVLLADLSLTETQTIDKNLTLDLNKHNVASLNCRAFLVTAGTVAITGSGTVSATADENVNTSTFPTSSSVIRVGSNDATTSFTLGADVTVSSDYCYGITYFGTKKQTVVINGTVAVTGEQAAISGNGHANYNTAAGGSDVTVNGTVSASQDYAIYNPQTGTTVINGTVTGPGGIEVKAGTVTVGAKAQITATGTPSYTQSNQNGTSTVGYAIAAVSNASYKEQPPVVTVESGAKVTGTVIAIMENSAEQLGIVKSAVNTLTIPEGFTWGTASEGYYTLAVSSGIDPTKPNSTQEVTPTAEEIAAAGSAEAAAIAKATVTVPTAAAEAGVDAATYKAYFTYSATPTETAGTYDVAITGFADEVTETADGNALAALEAATAGGTLSAEVAVKPGLYYGTAAGADVTKLKAPAGTLNTTGKLDLSGVTKPSTGEAFFIKIKVGTTAFTAEE